MFLHRPANAAFGHLRIFMKCTRKVFRILKESSVMESPRLTAPLLRALRHTSPIPKKYSLPELFWQEKNLRLFGLSIVETICELIRKVDSSGFEATARIRSPIPEKLSTCFPMNHFCLGKNSLNPPLCPLPKGRGGISSSPSSPPSRRRSSYGRPERE